jgi:ribosome-associated toxin RatA of RatAB toxin-antitoxin module
MPIAGWKLERVRGDSNRTKITFLIEMDYRGSIPSWVLSTAFKDQSKRLTRMKNLVQDIRNSSIQ